MSGRDKKGRIKKGHRLTKGGRVVKTSARKSSRRRRRR